MNFLSRLQGKHSSQFQKWKLPAVLACISTQFLELGGVLSLQAGSGSYRAVGKEEHQTWCRGFLPRGKYRCIFQSSTESL